MLRNSKEDFPEGISRIRLFNRADRFLPLLDGSLCADTSCAWDLNASRAVRAAEEFFELIERLNVDTSPQVKKTVNVVFTQIRKPSLRVLFQSVARSLPSSNHFPQQSLQSFVAH